MTPLKATAIAHPNIAFIKYWGDVDPSQHLPANGSISMNLDALSTMTTVAFVDDLPDDQVILNGTPPDVVTRQRVGAHLDHLREWAGTDHRAQVFSRNSFPAGTGLASSASAFAALTLAAAAALDLALPKSHLSAMARLGSGSASRSIPAGFVEWAAGESHETSCAFSIAPPDHWTLCDCIAVTCTTHKVVGSTEGKARATTSPIYRARVESARAALDPCRAAIHARDLAALGALMETDAVLMHAVTMTSHPPVYYWMPTTLAVLQSALAWRAEGLPVYFTLDAGPNVHCLCEETNAAPVAERLRAIPGVKTVIVARPGPGAHLTDHHLF